MLLLCLQANKVSQSRARRMPHQAQLKWRQQCNSAEQKLQAVCHLLVLGTLGLLLLLICSLVSCHLEPILSPIDCNNKALSEVVLL